ncbi:MAG: LacI family transcriptional regulator [Variovorax paradoxus]|uniref:LacI family transcriptional regulator n=1 Tax=Variovorax paradoxus TaxID=34073 RepID=A0A2W5QID7_VARPD|nr:MAG: LacI family transcriptional regulator [Variovorax paradoxus]
MKLVCSRRLAIVKTLTTVACAAVLGGPAFAQSFPTKPITFVVPYPAGGASDVFARLIAERLQASLKQAVVVENRPGANGIIAYQHVAKAPADGHTILMANIGPSAINPSLYKKLPYDAMKDFDPITMVSWVPLVLVANPGLGVSTVPELIAKAKATPGGLSYGVSGIGTAGHLAMEMFKSNAGVDIKPINYKGDTPALADTIAGHVDVMMATVVAAAPHIATGKLKALAVTTPKRLDVSPNYPTVAEAGMAGFEAVSWGGVLAPAGTPKPVVDLLNAEIVKALKTPEVKQRFEAAGAQVVFGSPEDFTKYIAAETAKWGRIAKAANVSLD